MANEDDKFRAAQLNDWLDDLEIFSPLVVEKSCREWRRMNTKRPLIADIRRLCVEESELQAMKSRPRSSQHVKQKPADDAMRSYWRDLPVHDWSKAELETANMECTALAHKYGFKSGDDRLDRSHYAQAALSGECPPYDVKTGREGKIRSWKISSPVILAPQGEPAREITDDM
ncbi:MAG: hypothetical protein KGJ13_05235 [Patescibacteria group bacterium]|nr:hypothetical protein [Patescibacteria group bacterium]